MKFGVGGLVMVFLEVLNLIEFFFKLFKFFVNVIVFWFFVVFSDDKIIIIIKYLVVWNNIVLN